MNLLGRFKPRTVAIYSDYLKSPHWFSLKSKLITRNKAANCFICSKKGTFLVLHHLKYKNLYHEKLFGYFLFFSWGDLVVLCPACHTAIHYIYWLGLFPQKVPIKRGVMIKRLFWLKSLKSVQNYRIDLFLQSVWGLIFL